MRVVAHVLKEERDEKDNQERSGNATMAGSSFADPEI
jgi:hypothetical protein